MGRRRSAPLILAASLVVAAGCGAPDAADDAVSAPATTSPTSASAPAPTTTAAPTTTTAPTRTAPTTTAAPTTTTAPLEVTRPAEGCQLLDDAESEADGSWFIVNDGVMGGRSSATGGLEDSVLTLVGEIVTDGGGFSSVRLLLPPGALVGTERFVLRLSTDGRPYEITADDALEGRDRRVSHQAGIPATGDGWEVVEVPFADLRPQLFGTPVDDAPFAPELATEVGIILNDGADGPFELSVDWIAACP